MPAFRALRETHGAPGVRPLPLTDDELAAWLRLATTHGLRPAALRALLATFGLPQRLFAQPLAALAATVGEHAARAVLAPPARDFAQRLAALQTWRAQPGCAVVTLADPAYPPRLLTTPDPPPLLYVEGPLDWLHARAIAVVGSRSATPQGIEDAHRFARAFSDAGLVVVSGLALGIDQAAHCGALAGLTGTVAIVGTGMDIVYPRGHRALAARIVAQGAVASEWPLGTPARPAHFPQRNRLIAGLADGVLVVEAAWRSGSLITARLANEMGRDVFALPGSIHAPLARGCHRLLREGARLVETPDEVLDELGVVAKGSGARAGMAEKSVAVSAGYVNEWGADATTSREQAAALKRVAGASAGTGAGRAEISPGHAAGPESAVASCARAAVSKLVLTSSETRDEARLLAASDHTPATFETLAQRTGLSEAALQGALLRLELSGQLCALPGGRFVRVGRD